MVRCPNCTRENPDDARFCANCGTALTPPAPAPPPRGEERRLVSVLFADLVDSVTLSDSLDTEDYRALLERFYSTVAEQSSRFGGTVEKYIGDAALAIFGLPEVHEDDAERAVRAALAMREALDRLNAQLTREGAPQLNMRIAVNTGEVVADPKGGGLGEFRLAADAVNVAARLQQHGKTGWILIGPRTERLVRGIVDAVSIGQITLKGKPHPVEAWQVVGLRAERAQRGIPGRQAPLIGRGEEMDLLLRLYDRVAREKRVHLVTVLGAPGVGKSRLQQEFAALLRALPDPPAIRKGRCLPYGDGLAFAPVAEILKQDARILDDDPADVARKKLTASLALWLPDDAERIAEALGFLVGLVYPGSAIAGYNPKSAREEAFVWWRRYLTARATAQPVVLVFEDIHWADDGLLELLDYTTARLREVPVLLLCLARPELLERHAQWGTGGRNAATVNLEPLTESESRALIAALLNVDNLPESVRADILTRAEGNPFFVEEIVRMLMEQGAIVDDGGRWRASTEITSIPLPDTVQGVIAARLDRLPDDEKHGLQQAAVIGRIFWLGTLRALASDGPGPDIPRLLDSLENRDLIREHPTSSVAGDREFIFKHALTREVAYASIPRTVRAPLHGKAAEWFELMVAERLDEVVDLLAYHWRNAGDTARALKYLIRAGDRAKQLFANRRAIDAYSQALAMGGNALPVPEAAEVKLRRGEVLQVLGQYDAAQADFEAALQLARQQGDRRRAARLQYEITRIHHRRLSLPLPQIIADYEEARRLAADVGDRRTEGLCLTEIATAYWDQVELDRASDLGQQSLAILQELGDHAALAGVMNLMAMTRFMLLDPAGGVAHARTALEAAHLAGDRSREGTALSYLALFLSYKGEIAESMRLLDQAEHVADEIGDRRRLMWIETFRTFDFTSLGRFDRAVAASERAYQLAKEIGYPHPGPPEVVAWSCVQAGLRARARETIEEAVRLVAGFPSEGPTAYGAQALVLFDADEIEAAKRVLAQASEALDRFPRADHLIVGGAWVALGWHMVGEPAQARTWARRVQRQVPQEWLAEVATFAHIVLGRVATDEGNFAESERELRAAAETLGDLPFVPTRVELELGWHALRHAQGYAADAQSHLTNAEAMIVQLTSSMEDPRIREAFQTSFLARRVQRARETFAATT